MDKLGGLLAIWGVLFLTGATRADEAKPYSVETIKDVVYHDGPDQHPTKHKLDLYLPKGPKDFPVLFFVHGGSWVHGDKGFLGLYGLLAKNYARQGVGVVVTNYRLSPGVKHPEHVKDVARAFAWTVRNIERHGGDPKRVFACGHSAGGHLVSLLTTDETYLKACGVTTRAIRGVIPISGVYSIPDRFLPSVFGDQASKASPLAHVRPGLPPFLLLYAQYELPLLADGAREFGAALKAAGNDAEVTRVAGRTHESILFWADAPDDPVSRAITDFVARHRR